MFDVKFMRAALKEAYKAKENNEVPVGAVVVFEDKIIARGRNTREETNVSVNHAEIIAITKACKKLKSWRLEGCDLYVTRKPCAMCAGAVSLSRIQNVYYGAEDTTDAVFKVNYAGGILKEESAGLLKEFFKELRK